MFWYLVVVAAALGAAYYMWSRRRLYRPAREIRSGDVKAYPIIGHAYKFLGTSEDRMKTMQLIGDIANWQGGLMIAWLAHKLFVCMTDPKSIEVVTKACLDKDEFTMKFTRTVIGYGTIFAPVSMWHTRRKIMAPFFSLKNLHQLVPVFQEKSTIMADLMRSEAGGGDFSMWKYITTYTFDSVCETAVGIRINSQEDPDFFVLIAINKVHEMVCERILQPWMHPDFIYERLPVYKKFTYHRDRFNSFVDEIVQKKRKEFAAIEPKDKETHRNGLTCYLDMIIQSSGGEEKGYTDIELREEVIVMIIAGNDTSAVSASFTAVMLSRYPEIQDKVYQELFEVFGDSDRAVTPEDLSRLKYLEAVIKESLRIYPPAAVVVREVHNDVVLRYTYAMLSMKTGLANLVRRYKLLPPANMAAEDLKKPLRVYFEITIKAVDGFNVRVEERNKKL